MTRNEYFERVEKDKDFNGEDASINVVSQKEQFGSTGRVISDQYLGTCL
jgi:hypothetical protein